MIHLHSAQTAFEIHNLCNVLRARGIACEARGQYLRGAIGEIPPNECWVELWLLDEAREDEARQLLAAANAESDEPWICPNCDEKIEGTFGQCWSCGTEPASSDQDTV